MFQAHYNLGTALQVAGRLDEAAEAYRSALVGDPGLAEAHNNLGTIHLSYGKYEEAAICFEAALGLRSDFAQAWNNLGTADSDRGEEERACEHFRQALKHDPDHVDALTNLATVLHKRGRVDEAVDGFRKALRLDPAKHVARARLRQAVGKVVPGWHFPMMNDAFCNQAYERAVRGAVTAETRVLDIGTGAGLLSLMAARAGARHVTSCEMVRVVAAKAKEVIAHNGFAERITVVPKKSNDIRVGVELPEPADLLVAEILSSDLLGEHVLPAVEHARAELLKPDARMIPYACGVVGFLGGGEDLERRNRVADVCGFELSPFNEFAPLRFSIRRQNYPYHRYSEDFEVFVFDFTTTPRFAAERKVLRIPVTQTGRCQGVVQWLKCWLDADNVFENHPDLPNPSSGWAHLFHAFPETVSLKAGETVRLIAEHDRLNLFIHLDGIESP